MNRGPWLTPSEDGYLTITSRLKGLITRGGEKISPTEIDDVLLAHPAVADAAAFGVPDRRRVRRSRAAVVLKGDADVESLRAFCLNRRFQGAEGDPNRLRAAKERDGQGGPNGEPYGALLGYGLNRRDVPGRAEVCVSLPPIVADESRRIIMGRSLENILTGGGVMGLRYVSRRGVLRSTALGGLAAGGLAAVHARANRRRQRGHPAPSGRRVGEPRTATRSSQPGVPQPICVPLWRYCHLRESAAGQ